MTEVHAEYETTALTDTELAPLSRETATAAIINVTHFGTRE